VLLSMFRLIYLGTHNRSSVSLTNWMFTGGLPAILVGFTQGVLNLIKLHFDPKAIAAAWMLIGILVFYLAL